MSNDRPAILGGRPVFEETIPLARPTTVGLSAISRELETLLSSGQLTNGRHVATLERLAADYLEVDEAVAVSCCTSGLMLVLRALDLEGQVILPSFTFAATAHAVVWNGLEPVFVDCDPGTYAIDPGCVEAAITPETAAIVATYIFGNPPDMTALEEIARDRNVRLVFDAAHAFGSYYGDRHAGTFGDAEVFSLSPTKPLVAGEGGLVTLRSPELAWKLRIGRDYGNPGDYDCQFIGMNARMPEISALLAVKNIEQIEDTIRRREEIASRYCKLLRSIPGISFQYVPEYCRSTYKDFSLFIHPHEFGIDRDLLALALAEEKISTRRYFYPPVHLQRAYARWRPSGEDRLPMTMYVAKNVLSIPLYTDMEERQVEGICRAISRIQMSAGEISGLRRDEMASESLPEKEAPRQTAPVQGR